MKSLFCIVSAIGNNYGRYTYRERFDQLVESIQSIKTYSPNSDIMIFDTSYQPLPLEDLKTLRNLTNGLRMLYNSREVKKLSEFNQSLMEPNKRLIKSTGEKIAVKAILNYLITCSKHYDRIFKLTGRYVLNQFFTNVNYDNCKDRIVIHRRLEWPGGFIFPIRLWSFDYSQTNQIHLLYNRLDKDPDVIEFTMYKYITELNIPVIELDSFIGLEGPMGFEGHFVRE